jgi:hypothetical protein
MPLHDRIILDLCAGTGAWSEPYVKAGYDVRRITLPLGDVLTYEPPSGVHGVLAAPPCTHFSRARTRAKTPRDFLGAMEIVNACLRIIWLSRIAGSLKWWALENPCGFLRQFLGDPPYTFKPCEFGDPSGKVTDLWGYFDRPKKLRQPIEFEYGSNGASRWHDSTRKSEVRAITPPKFAQAFFDSNP